MRAVKCSPGGQETELCSVVHSHGFVGNGVKVPALPKDLALICARVKKIPPFLSLGNFRGSELVTSSVLRMVKGCPHLNRKGLLVPALFSARITLTLILGGDLLFSILYICFIVTVLSGPLPKPIISVTRMSRSEGMASCMLPGEARLGKIFMGSFRMESI